MGEVGYKLTASKPRVVIFVLILGIIGAISFFIINSQDVKALDENNCLSCHSNLDLKKENGDGQTISLRISEAEVNSGAHKYIDCTTCHSADPHASPPKLTKLSSAEKCGTCHQYEYKQHLESVHGQQLLQGNADVATCVDCHSPKGDAHSIIRVLEYGAPTFKKNIADTCAKCHNDEELMRSYGIVDKVYESYMRTYHGKMLGLNTNDISQLNAATCISCHGTHDIKAIDNPDSPVAGMDNLARTCESCHQGAGIEFAKGFLGHKEASPTNIPAAHYVGKVFNILLYSVLGVGGVVLIGAIIGYTRNRWRV